LVSIFLYSKWREKATSKKLENERRNQELEEARKLQNSLLPKKIPTRKDYDISVYLKSATEVGGDYYDFIENENKDLYAICGDATGHGVVSGIMVSVTKAGLNGINMDNPSKILNNLNSIVKRVNFGRLRMSLSVAKINNGSIELSSAAMPPTYYYNAKKNNVEEILVPNLPLGGIEGEKFDGVKKDFKKGDVVVMISDGLPELPNKEDVLLDYPKVLECIKNNCNESADEIKDALVRMSDSWADGLMNPDDITIVVIKKAS
jgi:sigma-B regulation protein RsbU (phosphoserine phosphatase)